MKEKIFNLFLYIENDVIRQLGFVVHEIEGNDAEKMEYLRFMVNNDFMIANKAIVKSCSYGTSNGEFKYSSYLALARLGRHIEVFEEIFSICGAHESPLFCVTPIVNGLPEIDIMTNHAPFFLGEFENHPKIGSGRMKDYLEAYLTQNGFDMPSLVHDDYFGAIMLLFNNGHYVSCMKLIASFIDTVSFIEFGDTLGNFVKWLQSYSNIINLGITENQLWELRNSVLHMSNLDSRKVLSGKEKRISFSVAASGVTFPEDIDTKYFNLRDFIDEIAQSLSKWFMSYNNSPDKIITFIERYDRIISDSRHAIKSVKQKP